MNTQLPPRYPQWRKVGARSGGERRPSLEAPIHYALPIIPPPQLCVRGLLAGLSEPWRLWITCWLLEQHNALVLVRAGEAVTATALRRNSGGHINTLINGAWRDLQLSRWWQEHSVNVKWGQTSVILLALGAGDRFALQGLYAHREESRYSSLTGIRQNN